MPTGVCIPGMLDQHVQIVLTEAVCSFRACAVVACWAWYVLKRVITLKLLMGPQPVTAGSLLLCTSGLCPKAYGGSVPCPFVRCLFLILVRHSKLGILSRLAVVSARIVQYHTLDWLIWNNMHGHKIQLGNDQVHELAAPTA